MKTLITRALVVTAFACAAAVPAAATTITFEGIAPPGGSVVPGTPYVEGGFTLTSNHGANGIFDAAHSSNDNGTDFFGWCASDCGPQTLSLTGPSGFSINGLDVGASGVTAPGTAVNLLGFFVGGGTIGINPRHSGHLDHLHGARFRQPDVAPDLGNRPDAGRLPT